MSDWNDQAIGPAWNDAPTAPPPAEAYDNTALADHFHDQLTQAVAQNKTPDGEKKPFSFDDAVQAGWQVSIQGLSNRQKMPDKTLPQDAPWYQRVASQAATLAGDAPTMIEGFGIGMAGGAELGPGAPIAGMGGAFGLPAGLRRIMIDSYQKGEIKTPGEFLSRAAGAFLDTAKGYITGAATEGAGMVAGASFKAASPLVQQAAVGGSQLGAMVTVSKGLDGKLPSKQDFIDGAVLIFGLKSAEFGAGKLMDVYEKTGVKPEQVIADAAKDPTLKADLLSNTAIPRAYEASVDPLFKVQGKGREFIDNANRQELERRIRLKPPKEQWQPADELITEYKKGLNAYLEKTGQKQTTETELEYLKSVGNDTFDNIDEAYITLKLWHEADKAEKDLSALNSNGGGSPPVKPPGGGSSSVPDENNLPAVVTPEQQSMNNILDRIQFGATDKEKTPFSFDKFYSDWVDNLDPIKRVTEDMMKGKSLPASQDPYKLFRNTRGGYERANQFITDATVDFKTYKPNGSSLEEVLTPIKDNYKQFVGYATAVRGLELENQGVKTGFDRADLERTVNDPAYKNKYEAARQGLTDYNNRLLKYAQDSGLVSADTADLMRSMHENYIPYNRLIPAEDETGALPRGQQASSPFKRIKGSDLHVIDPVTSTIKNTYTIMTATERNYAATQILKVAKKTGNLGEGKLFEKIPDQMRKVTVGTKELAKHIREGGNNSTVINSGENAVVAFGEVPAGDKSVKVTYNPDNLNNMEVFRRYQQQPRADEIVVFNKGEREVYKLSDPELVTAFKGLPPGNILPMFNFITGFTKYFRAGTILNPDFMPRHMVRQNINAYMNSPTGMLPVWSALQGAVDMYDPKSMELLQQWRSSGGMNSEITAWDRRYIQNSIDKLEGGESLAEWIDRTKDEPLSMIKTAGYNSVQSALDMAHAVIATHDNYLRFGQFKATMEELNKQGITGKDAIIEAGYQSREVLLDNFRRGARMQAVNQIWAFSNLRMQGVDKLARIYKDDPVRFAARVAPIVTASALLWWANHDDPRYKEAQDWQKDNFWLIPLDEWRVPEQGDVIPDLPGMSREKNGKTEYNFGKMLRISKPQESGLLFGSSIERFLDFAQTKDPNTALKLAKSFKDAIVPEAIPSVALPVYEGLSNYSMFTGGPLVPASAENYLPAYQYNSYTNELSKAVGQLVGQIPAVGDTFVASPVVIENFVREWTGGLGMYALQVADKALRMTGALPDPIKPASTLADIPFIRAFVVRYPTASTQSITDFYDQYDHASKTYATFKMLMQNGNFDAAQRVMHSNDQDMVKLDGIRQALTNQQKMIQYIYDNPDMTSGDKRQNIDAIYYQMIMTAQMGNKSVKEMATSIKQGSQ